MGRARGVGEGWLPRGDEGDEVQALHPAEMRGDASLLAQVWQVLMTQNDVG